MKYIFIDETNMTEADGEFFIVGGLILDDSQVTALSSSVEQLRIKYGYSDSDSLKFQTKSKPSKLTIEEFNNIKAEAIQLLIEHNAFLLVYLILHKIIKEENKISYAYNALLHKFNTDFLELNEETGFVIVDRLPNNDAFDKIRAIFSQGIDTPSGAKVKPKNIIHYSVSADGTSHISSLVDIAIGAFRYSVNSISGKESQDVAAKLIPEVSKLIWYKEVEGRRILRGNGFLRLPLVSKVPAYEEKYAKLIEKLTEWSS